MTVLLPRLDRVAVDRCLADPEGLNAPIEAGLHPRSLPSGVHFAASGGSPASTEQLLQLRAQVVEVAISEGFPERGAAQNRARFDAAAAAALAQDDLLRSAETLRDDVWAFLTTVLLADVCAWRFPERPAERFHGGVRNTLQRLWMRAVALDRGEGHPERWALLEVLSEDALVQITERPSIGADYRVARAFAEEWVSVAARVGRNRMEDLTRAAVIQVRLRNQIQLLSAMDDVILGAFMQIAFGDSEHVLGATPTVDLDPGVDEDSRQSRSGWFGFKLGRAGS